MDAATQAVPSIAVDSSDHLHIVWHGKATGFTLYQVWYNKYDGSWAGPVRISDYDGMSGRDQRYPSIAVDGSDNLHVVWDGKATGFTADNQIWYNKYDGAWAGPVRISDYAGMESYGHVQAAVAIDSNDYIHVAWLGGAVWGKVWYNKYDGAWAGPVLISTYDSMAAHGQGGVAIAIDSNDYIHVVWHGRATGFITDQIWYNKYTTSWAEPVRISDYAGMGSYSQNYPSIAVDATNAVHVLWYGKATGYTDFDKIWRAKYVTSWGTPELLQDMESDLTRPNLRWSRYPSSNRPYAGVDYVFFDATNIYWDKKGYPVILTPIVTTDPATALSVIAATPNGKLDSDGGEACECGFEWGLDTGYGTTTPPQSKTTGETFSQVIGGLFPNTTYHFRAFATNSVGTGRGDDRTFATALVISKAYALAREEL